MKTRQLQTMWWDWLSTSERFLRSLHEQTAALTLRDVARVQRIQPEIDALYAKLNEIDEKAVTCAKKLVVELGGEEPSLRGLVQVLDKAEAQQVQGLANRVKVTARNMHAVVEKNQALIQNELTFVNGTLSLLAKAACDQQAAMRPLGSAVVSTSVALDTAA